MKSCPKCNRTYDDSFSFCLEDGSVLSSSYAERSTEAKTENYNRQNTAFAENKTKTNSWKYILAGFLMILCFGLMSAFAYFGIYKNEKSGDENISVKNGNLAENSNSNVKTLPTSTPSQTNINSNNSNSDSNANMDTNVNKPSPTPTKTAENDTPDNVLKKMKQGMSYAKARKMLTDSGWQYVVGSPTRELFGQEEYIFKTLKFYEMETCSGTGMGYCRFLFKDVNKRKLAVVTVNNEEGSKGGPIVDNWSIEK